ncbi:hypothetical protein K449DRAFT_466671 [Hypoxylon sp. EC38]|nr:hypothetical protein K449DRAFT_466671 [Hypoxylon sp. EC38]
MADHWKKLVAQPQNRLNLDDMPHMADYQSDRVRKWSARGACYSVEMRVQWQLEVPISMQPIYSRILATTSTEVAMEAIATLSLVCNVMQVISFTGEIVNLYKQIRDNGSPESDLESNTAHLSALVLTLEERTSEFDFINSNVGRDSSFAESQTQLARIRLKNLAADLVGYTKELQSILGKVTTAGSTGGVDRLKTAFKYKFHYQEKISFLEKKIDRTRNVLNVELLSRICSSTQASHCRSDETFSNLHEEIKQFINNWSEGKRTISDLIISEGQAMRDCITAEAEQTRRKFDLLVVSTSSRRELEELRKRILSTLWFPEMNQRENGIAEASDDIVRRIFPERTQKDTPDDIASGDDSVQARLDDAFQKPITDFVDWLQSDGPIFWITGKPGSGKSTLAKHLIHSSQMAKHLQTWKPLVQIFRFYFYELGENPLQRQLQGCFRTLLHQILDNDHGVLEHLLREKPAVKKKMSEHDWSMEELRNTLFLCLRYRTSATCLFLDGLDEIVDGERRNVLESVDFLGQIQNVKVCATSRPEDLFRRCLEPYPTLQVQDVNSHAILSYAKRSLDKYRDSFEVSDREYIRFLQSLLDKSEGVFLWTAMALKSLIEGIEKHGDSWELLKMRIEKFAPDLYGLYKQMWKRQNADLPVYKQQAAEIFWCVVYWDYRPLTLLNCLLATRPDLRAVLQRLISSRGYWMEDDDIRICQQYVSWLSARSAGLLEIVKNFNPSDPFNDRVTFIHRSAKEFLQRTKEGQQILDRDDRPVKAKYCSYIRAVREAGYVLAANWMLLSGTLGIEYSLGLRRYEYVLSTMGEPLLGEVRENSFREWMPPPDRNPLWVQRILHACAEAGDKVVLDQIHQMDAVYEHISLPARSRILFSCCEDLAPGFWLPWFLDKSKTIEWNTKWLRLKIEGIIWLVNHDADPHMIYQNDSKRYLRFTASPLTAFSMFLTAVLGIIIEFSSYDQYADMKKVIKDIQNIFGPRKTDGQADSIIIHQTGFTKTSIRSCRILVEVTPFFNAMNRIINASGPAEIQAIFNGYMWDSTQLEVETSNGWQRPALGNCIQKLGKLKIILMGYIVHLAVSTGDICNALSEIVWEDVTTNRNEFEGITTGM